MVEGSFALLLGRGGLRRVWARGRENIHKRYLIHVAGYNQGLIMRHLTRAGTPREIRVPALVMLFAFLKPDEGLILVGFAAIGNQSAALDGAADPTIASPSPAAPSRHRRGVAWLRPKRSPIPRKVVSRPNAMASRSSGGASDIFIGYLQFKLTPMMATLLRLGFPSVRQQGSKSGVKQTMTSMTLVVFSPASAAYCAAL
jgi:hypothetical protein